MKASELSASVDRAFCFRHITEYFVSWSVFGIEVLPLASGLDTSR
jgi:hypothetical protein